MTTQYIVKFITNDVMTDCYVELSKNKSNIPIITVSTQKNALAEGNQVLLYKFMTNNFAQVKFDDDMYICTLSYTVRNQNQDSVIIFDASSSSAYTAFKKTFNEMYNTKYETEYYRSGNELYVGEVLYQKNAEGETTARVPHGNGTMYYDSPDHRIKYTGEFENGLYDGAGIFYHMDNKTSLTCNNISAGVPTQKGTLSMNYRKRQDNFTIVFNEVWEKLNVSTKDLKKTITMCDGFVLDIMELYWTDANTTLESLMFNENSLDDKYFKLWTLVKEQESTLANIAIDNKEAFDKMSQTIKYYIIVSTILLTFFMSFGW
jgi:hypothetical protein